MPQLSISLPASAQVLVERLRKERGPFFVSRVLMRVNVTEEPQRLVASIVAASRQLGFELEG